MYNTETKCEGHALVRPFEGVMVKDGVPSYHEWGLSDGS